MNSDEDAITEAANPAEELRSVYHAVTWQKDLGGAGITPEFGKWKNVLASFPLHNQFSNGELLRRWSKTTTLTVDDLDVIRDLYGEKVVFFLLVVVMALAHGFLQVAFYFAFMQSYSLFLIFPTLCGIVCWLYLGSYSLTFAVITCLWSIVFVEYWRMRETDLSLRWGVKGVTGIDVNRVQYFWEREIRDPITGERKQLYSNRKQLLRQLLLLPFVSVATVALGTLIVVIFAMEMFISEVYVGRFKGYLQFLPTVLFSLSLPTITSFLTAIATRLTDFENYRTEDEYEEAQTQKTFVMNFITSFLPTILTAFVYVPFGDKVVPYLNLFHLATLKSPVKTNMDVNIDANRLQQEVIYLSATAQALNFGEEIVLPYFKHYLWQIWRDYRLQRERVGRSRSHSTVTDMLLLDPPGEMDFLQRVRNEAEADKYSVQDDILEMCVQFGYLALFGVAWPLVPLGFLLNNWLEVRGDFFKLSQECQRPSAGRSDTIGPSLQGLEFLSWLGTLSSAAIIHLYRGPMKDVRLSKLLLILFIAEQVYLITRLAVRTAMHRLGSDTVRREEARQYSIRKSYLETRIGRSYPSSPAGRTKPPVRFSEHVTVYPPDSGFSSSVEEHSASTNWDPAMGISRRTSARGTQFWSLQDTAEEAANAGVKLIRVRARTKPREAKDMKKRGGMKKD